MFGKSPKKDKRTNLEKEIDEVLKYMESISPESEEYTTITENLERLYKVKASEKDRKWSIPPEVVFTGVFGLLQILLIMNYEKTDIITTKALGWVSKGKL